MLVFELGNLVPKSSGLFLSVTESQKHIDFSILYLNIYASEKKNTRKASQL